MNTTEHLLDCLAEECAEVIQRVTKANRFGLNEIQPGQTLTNAQRIVQELHDVEAVVQMLQAEGALAGGFDAIATMQKKEKLRKYMGYARACGTLTEEPCDSTPNPGTEQVNK